MGNRQCGRALRATRRAVQAMSVERRARNGPWVSLAVAALWIAAAGIEFAVPAWGRAIAALGDMPPRPTALAMSAARLHVAWWIAGLGTLLVAFLWLRRSRWCTPACALALFASVLGVTLVAWAMALPLHGQG